MPLMCGECVYVVPPPPSSVTDMLQVEQVRVNKAKAHSMKSRVDALMRIMTVSLLLSADTSCRSLWQLENVQHVARLGPAARCGCCCKAGWWFPPFRSSSAAMTNTIQRLCTVSSHWQDPCIPLAAVHVVRGA
jgi:hypothetical protein